MSDDQDGFHAPPIEVPMPFAMRRAGRRLHVYAELIGYPHDRGLLSMPIDATGSDADKLRKAQRLLAWWLDQSK